MAIRPRRYDLLFAAVAVAGAALDLASKAAVSRRFAGAYPQHDFIPGVLELVWKQNTGVAFSLFENQNGVFIALSSLAVLILPAIYLSLRRPTLPAALGLSLILGGTLGNLYDRIIYGCVRDFLKLLLFEWPIFNLADAFICVGAILFAIEILFRAEPKAPPAAPAPDPAAARPVEPAAPEKHL